MWKTRALGLVAAASLLTAGAALAAGGKHFGTHLHGAQEVPARQTHAQGQATFQANEDGTELSYKLNVANIANVFQAHIHLGPSGANGPIVVWLYPSTAPTPGPLGGGRVQGGIAEGTITAANLVGPLAGQPLSALIAAIEAGNTYVNVHTNDGVDPPNTGPGDFPGGEIRGQLP
jgi:CHRD domain